VEHEFDALEPLCVVPPDDAAELGTHDANMPKQPSSGGTEPKTLPCAAPENPEVADELEPDREAAREPAIFDNDEEYVGLDDEAVGFINPGSLEDRLLRQGSAQENSM